MDYLVEIKLASELSGWVAGQSTVVRRALAEAFGVKVKDVLQITSPPDCLTIAFVVHPREHPPKIVTGKK
jgi:hypothetical protein